VRFIKERGDIYHMILRKILRTYSKINWESTQHDNRESEAQSHNLPNVLVGTPALSVGYRANSARLVRVRAVSFSSWDRAEKQYIYIYIYIYILFQTNLIIENINYTHSFKDHISVAPNWHNSALINSQFIRMFISLIHSYTHRPI
jgi:hypothetical protein